ncbi:hypothetical protein JXB28_01400 [Candidatus Woesearchaeota archaeon]|nr:hypothetical protein [Candidatus Woesearchaeota archaeon]
MNREDCLKQAIEKYVKPADEGPVIDWSFMHTGFKKEICDHLLKVGVLSGKTSGNYVLITRGGLLNPSLGSIILYFTREEDAKKYREASVNNPVNKISIAKFYD